VDTNQNREQLGEGRAMQTDQQAPETPTDRSAAYEFSIDASSDNTHANVIRMVGSSHRVLELGPATGYMTEMLRANDCSVVGIEIDPDMARQAAQFCERVIVGDLDELDFQSELGEERFDVIVAADVLEHLKDPLGVLRRLRSLLSPEGFFVVSLPNIAHAGVRLALLQGRFEYRDLGLLDRTHLRFFTHESIAEMFDEAELAVVELHRQEAPITISDVQVDIDAVPEELIRGLEADPEARTYQFVIKALPLELPGLRELQRRLYANAEAKDAAEHRLAVAQPRLRELEDAAEHRLAVAQPRLRELEDALTSIAGREAQLTASLIDAHDQVLRRDEEVERLQDKLRGMSSAADRVKELEAQMDRQVAQAAADSERQAAQIAARDEQIVRLRLRLERILDSPPARVWARVGRLPLLRSISAKRTLGYERALQRHEHPDE
jgi:2-polyprenyl-3-methyl-5-hydroxy-6-metoxy-1,4-benzoquinol methylase